MERRAAARHMIAPAVLAHTQPHDSVATHAPATGRPVNWEEGPIAAGAGPRADGAAAATHGAAVGLMRSARALLLLMTPVALSAGRASWGKGLPVAGLRAAAVGLPLGGGLCVSGRCVGGGPMLLLVQRSCCCCCCAGGGCGGGGCCCGGGSSFASIAPLSCAADHEYWRVEGEAGCSEVFVGCWVAGRYLGEWLGKPAGAQDKRGRRRAV
jgi:hypothetical protein